MKKPLTKHINQMCLLCSGEYTNPRVIDCSRCKTIKYIPTIEGLQNLRCYGCPNLRQISYQPDLRVLECAICPQLEEIPESPLLHSLYCSGCLSLKTIPLLPSLERLECCNNPQLRHVCLQTTISSYSRDSHRVVLNWASFMNCPLLSYAPKFDMRISPQVVNCPLLTNTASLYLKEHIGTFTVKRDCKKLIARMRLACRVDDKNVYRISWDRGGIRSSSVFPKREYFLQTRDDIYYERDLGQCSEGDKYDITLHITGVKSTLPNLELIEPLYDN